MRVFELAKSMDLPSSTLLRESDALGVEARSPLSTLDDEDIAAFRKLFASRKPTDSAEDKAVRDKALVAKRERARLRINKLDEAEQKLLNDAIRRAREYENKIKGIASPVSDKTSAQVEPVAEPATPEVKVESQPSEPAAKILKSTEDLAQLLAPVTTADDKEKRDKSAPPDEATEVKPTPKLTVRQTKSSRVARKVHFDLEDTIDPDEDIEAAFVGGRKALRTQQRPEKTRQSSSRGDREPERRLAHITSQSSHGASKREAQTQQQAAPKRITAPVAPTPVPDNVITVRGAPIVKDLAELLGLRPNRVIADLMQLNVLASINQRVEMDIATRIASKYGYKLEVEKPRRSTERKPLLRRDDADDDIPEDSTEDLLPRPPVVTFLGHVDHGKTSLMDRIRKAKVASGESGGITQHIGAYSVSLNGRSITFLDTPGHAAFSAMRARGANLTDVAVIIIAADDGIMPQTKEVIKQAKQANVQIIVAINKCDLPTAKPERILQQLQGEGLTPEEWGGDIVACKVSAMTGEGIDHLLEMILLQADMLELSANPNRRADGFVVEAQLEMGRGPTATLLVSGGTLKVGDVVLCGEYFGKIRGLMDDRGRLVKAVGPATAVKCMGLSGVPEAGARFRVMLNEKRARELAEKYADERKQATLSTAKVASLDALMDQFSVQEKLELHVIVKADTQGSCEAIVESLKDIRSTKVGMSIVSSEIGNITSNDIQRAAASNAIMVGFHVGSEPGVQSLARHSGVLISTFRIIYELLDHVRQEMLNLLAPEYRETVRGHAEIRAIFGVGKRGKVAGCYVTDGVIRQDARLRVLRHSEKIFEGKLMSLYHFQNEVAEIRSGQECGMRFLDFEAFEEGDKVECFTLEELERTL